MLRLSESIFGLVNYHDMMPMTPRQNYPRLKNVLHLHIHDPSIWVELTRDVAFPRSFRRRPAVNSTSAWFPRRLGWAVSHDTELSQG